MQQTSVRAAETAAAPDFEAIKTRQQSTWASGDFGQVGVRLQIVGETLCEAVELLAGERVLDVAAGNGNASLAAAEAGIDDYLFRLNQDGAYWRYGPPPDAEGTGGNDAFTTCVPVPGAASAASDAPRPHRNPKNSPSSRLFDARRLAPCSPLDVTSPAAHSPGSEVWPAMSTLTPPIM